MCLENDVFSSEYLTEYGHVGLHSFEILLFIRNVQLWVPVYNFGSGVNKILFICQNGQEEIRVLVTLRKE